MPSTYPQPEWIPYPHVTAVLRRLEDSIDRGPGQACRHSVLVGPPNNGKTAVIDRLLAMHPPSLDRWAERTHLPVLSLETPPTPLFRKLFKSALRKIGALVIPCDRKEAVEYLGAVLEAVGTRVIAVDQAQHILAGFPFQQEEFLSFLVGTARRAQASASG